MQEAQAANKALHHRGVLPVCLLLSLFAHGVLATILILTLPQGSPPPKLKGGNKKYTLTVTRPQDKGEQETPEEEKIKPFIKTDSERPQLKPKEADFEGARDARAEGMNITTRQDDTPAPTMEGEIKEERNVLEQKRQDGDVKHEEEISQEPTPQPELTEQNEENTENDAPIQPQEETTEEEKDTESQQQAELNTESATEESPTEDTPITPEPAEAESGIIETPQPPPTPKASLYPQRNGARRPVYDPSQAPHAQSPGLRTEEKRSRSTGHFVIGKRPSWDVEATPRGEYEALVYRLIASKWYFACDRHRGDITPGTLIILLRLDTRGRIVDMKCVSKRGAGILQESFTYKSIRQAQFPPMPQEVIKSLKGEQMEFFITFDFN